MDQEDTRRVTTTLPLNIGRTDRPTGTVLELPAADAQALMDAGRAVAADGAEPDPDREPEPEPIAEQEHEALRADHHEEG